VNRIIYRSQWRMWRRRRSSSRIPR